MLSAAILAGLFASHVLSNPIANPDLLPMDATATSCKDRLMDSKPGDGVPGDGYNCELCLAVDFKFTGTTPALNVDIQGALLDIPMATENSDLAFYPDGVDGIPGSTTEDPADADAEIASGRTLLKTARKLPGPSDIWRSSNYRKTYDDCCGCWIFINAVGELEYVLDTAAAISNEAQADHLFEGQQIGGFLLWAGQQGLLRTVGGVQGAWDRLTKCKTAFNEIKNIINNPVNFWGLKTEPNRIKGNLLGEVNPFNDKVDTAIFKGVRASMAAIRKPYMETATNIGKAIEQILKIPGIAAAFRQWAEDELERVLRELDEELEKRARVEAQKQMNENPSKRAKYTRISTFNPPPNMVPIKGRLFDYVQCGAVAVAAWMLKEPWDKKINA